jgi:hypothetical protein
LLLLLLLLLFLQMQGCRKRCICCLLICLA